MHALHTYEMRVLLGALLLGIVSSFNEYGTYGNPVLSPWMINSGSSKQSQKFHNSTVADPRFPCSRAVSRWTRKELHNWLNIQADNLHYHWPEKCPWNPRNDAYLLHERQKKFEFPYWVHIPSNKFFKKEYYIDLYIDKVAMNNISNLKHPSCLADYCLIFDTCSPSASTSGQSVAKLNQRCDQNEMEKAKSLCEEAMDECFPVGSTAKFLNIEARRKYCEKISCDIFSENRETENKSGFNVLLGVVIFVIVIIFLIGLFLFGGSDYIFPRTKLRDLPSVSINYEDEEHNDEYTKATNNQHKNLSIQKRGQRRILGSENFAYIEDEDDEIDAGTFTPIQQPSLAQTPLLPRMLSSPRFDRSPSVAGSGITFRELMLKKQRQQELIKSSMSPTSYAHSDDRSCAVGAFDGDRSPFLNRSTSGTDFKYTDPGDFT